jgi:crotonobetainyl-CoA:carnitine CoA-transferase CaiB-like acyl-CoA transferase
VRRQLAVGGVEDSNTTTIPETTWGRAGRRWETRLMDRRMEAWAASGAMALTGRADGPPLGVPGALIDLVAQATATLRQSGSALADLDGLALLGERAAFGQLSRQGAVSCGASTRLVPAGQGWLAVSLARPEDRRALPAWLERDIPVADPWPSLVDAVAGRDPAELDARAALLGLPIAAVGSVASPDHPSFGLPVTADPAGEATRTPSMPRETTLVVDLSALWAGPLCGQLLADAGARVIKVESTGRPDGSRQGLPELFDLLNGPKQSVAFDLRTAAGRADLRRLLTAADVVIESARPRALEQMGITAQDMLDETPGPQIWLSITSHGRHPGARERVGFGDVAAAAGGLVAHDVAGPCFLADAVADPLAGLVGAAAIHRAQAAGGRWLLSVAMAPLAASVAGPLLDAGTAVAAPPRARPIPQPAPALGADTASVLLELG